MTPTTIWYCPDCHKTYGTPFVPERECGNPSFVRWPSDLPLPTVANVRGLVAERDALRELVKAQSGVAQVAGLVREMRGACDR